VSELGAAWAMEPGVILDCVTAAGAAVCFDGAVLLQAPDARKIDQEHALRLSLLRQLMRRRRWLAGTILAALGWPLQLAALALAPVTIVQPILAVGLVVLLVAGRRVLGERVRPSACVGAIAVLVGLVVLAISAPANSERVPGAAELALVIGVLACSAIAPFARGRHDVSPWVLIGAAGAAFGLSAVTSKLLVIELAAHDSLSVAAWAATTGAAAGAGFLVDMSALQRFPATRVAPAVFVLETALPVVAAPLLFHERWAATPGGGAMLLVGLVVVLFGGVLLGGSPRAAAGR
jgi:drug/metabolite transporter (DMT)-like permease